MLKQWVLSLDKKNCYSFGNHEHCQVKSSTKMVPQLQMHGLPGVHVFYVFSSTSRQGLLRVKWCWLDVFTCRRWTRSSARSTHCTRHHESRSRSGWVWWLAAHNAPSCVSGSLTTSFLWRRNVTQRAPSCELTLLITVFSSLCVILSFR